MTADPATGPWHLDKRVPLVVVGAIIVQSFAIGTWTATVSSRVGLLENQMVARSELTKIWQNERLLTEGRLVALETEMKHANSTLLRIEGLIRLPQEERR